MVESGQGAGFLDSPAPGILRSALVMAGAVAVGAGAFAF